eukprot:CAMPEP_0169238252 /NCGR_PEP_ID=MMETSP1016-20121227/30240_1 /TAXON_ID=342587 /ORGANISM="Karlodinium micrum, Strain CCMP2283" /LENGTH=152 /DNA_ID=CAMNT_0009318029 /DNA_START=80 /DNA_END=538 /DNA_ORIENTATION=+
MQAQDFAATISGLAVTVTVAWVLFTATGKKAQQKDRATFLHLMQMCDLPCSPSHAGVYSKSVKRWCCNRRYEVTSAVLTAAGLSSRSEISEEGGAKTLVAFVDAVASRPAVFRNALQSQQIDSAKVQRLIETVLELHAASQQGKAMGYYASP